MLQLSPAIASQPWPRGRRGMMLTGLYSLKCTCSQMQNDCRATDERGGDWVLLHSAQAQTEGEDGPSQVRPCSQTTCTLCRTKKEIIISSCVCTCDDHCLKFSVNEFLHSSMARVLHSPSLVCQLPPLSVSHAASDSALCPLAHSSSPVAQLPTQFPV